MASVACHHSAQEPPLPAAPTFRLPSSGHCFVDISELTGAAMVFPDQLRRDGVVCKHPLDVARESHCVGVYVAITLHDHQLGGSTRYFDGERRLFAAYQSSDTTSYCGGTSFDVIYGTLPTCPTTPIVTDLCRR